MENELLELALARIAELERKLENYYEILRIDNELDFILKGTYILKQEIDDVVNGIY